MIMIMIISLGAVASVHDIVLERLTAYGCKPRRDCLAQTKTIIGLSLLTYA